MTGHRGSILLVDDEEKILKALGRALRGAGHEVVETTSPRQALRLLFERPFDVLVVDNIMPETTGLDLIREFMAGAGDSRTGGREGGPAERGRPAAQREVEGRPSTGSGRAEREVEARAA